MGRRPRLGFLGAGWIGRHRLAAIAAADVADIVAIVEPSAEMAAQAQAVSPGAIMLPDLPALLGADLDGVVIATPSALHADQTILALDAGLAVFCQKPLGRDAAETRAAVLAARRADRLLQADLSYRETAVAQRIHALIASGDLGPVHALDLVFHNAYGPDKPWFHDRALSGGGCVIDLGVHLIDLALWLLDFTPVVQVDSALFRQGGRLGPGDRAVEDYAVASLTLAGGAVVRLACSWNLHAGRPAEISLVAYGNSGGAGFHNVDGSFYDFRAEHFVGTERSVLVQPPDDWGGRAAVGWVRRLADSPAFDPAADRLVDVAHVIDAIYGCGLPDGSDGADRSETMRIDSSTSSAKAIVM